MESRPYIPAGRQVGAYGPLRPRICLHCFRASRQLQCRMCRKVSVAGAAGLCGIRANRASLWGSVSAFKEEVKDICTDTLQVYISQSEKQSDLTAILLSA